MSEPAVLTHKCRKFPSTRLNPEDCSKYEGKIPYCGECLGPVPLEHNPAVNIVQVSPKKTKSTSTSAPSEEKPKYKCKIHGSHNGFSISGRMSKKCPKCTEEKRVKSMQEYAGIASRFFAASRAYDWVWYWIQRESGKEEMDIFQFIFEFISKQIPQDDLRSMLMERSRKTITQIAKDAENNE